MNKLKEKSETVNKKNRIRRKKNRKKRKLKPEVKTYILLFMLSFLFVFASFTLLFKIKKVYIYGCEKYSQQEIIEASGIRLGENLLLFNKDKAAENITNSFAYVEKTEISKKLPGSLEINIKLETPEFFIENNEKYFLISLSGSVLEISGQEFDGVLKVKGLTLNNLDVLNSLEYVDKKIVINYQNEQEKLDLEEIKNNVKNIFQDKIKEINIKNRDKITLSYENRIEIIIGDMKNINYKMQTAKEIISTKLCEEDKGSLDVSLVETDGKSYFKPNEL